MVLSLWFEKNDSHVVGWRGCCLVVVVVMVCANTPATPPPHKKQRQPLPHKCCTSGMMWRRNAPHARVVLMCALAFCVCGVLGHTQQSAGIERHVMLSVQLPGIGTRVCVRANKPSPLTDSA